MLHIDHEEGGVAACVLITDLLVADHWLFVTECNLQRRKKALSKRLVSLNLTCKRQAGDALKLANKEKINENVYADVSNKNNYNSVFNKDNNVQVKQGHHYLLDKPEPTV